MFPKMRKMNLNFSIFNRLKIFYFIRFISAKLTADRRVISGQNFFIFLLFTFLSCSFLTNPDQTKVSGVVKLEGQKDHN